ncbi:MAG: hypothetical protein VZS44_08415 [Bacilli bacterium]|nr:hypothetical protein [Bacilli bacterium]
MEDSCFKKKYIYILALLYLLVSLIIFLIGNLKAIFSIPLVLLLLICFYKAINNFSVMRQRIFDNKRIYIVILLIVLWVVYSGIGGFIWQNPWDHRFRNAIFMDLVKYKWPVVNNNNLLCYYLGFWLPSALMGKLFGLNIGYLFQVLWAIIGLFITYGLLCQYLKKVKISMLLFFIFYSGLDIFLFLLFSKLSFVDAVKSVFGGRHIELITVYFNSSSNTTLLFWLYNQIIPFWIGMLLILLQKNSKSLLFIYSLMLLYSPFALVSLFPVIVYKILEDSNKISLKNINKFFSFQNIVSFIIIIIIAIYYKTNIAVGKINYLNINADILKKYVCYLFFEYFIYLFFIYKKNYKDIVLNILIVVILIGSFITMGNSYDFSWRICIPLSFYIMLLLMKELYDKKCVVWKRNAIIIIFLLGAITPVSEMIRTYKNEKEVLGGKIKARSDSLPTVFQVRNNKCYENFIGRKNYIYKIFYK